MKTVKDYVKEMGGDFSSDLLRVGVKSGRIVPEQKGIKIYRPKRVSLLDIEKKTPRIRAIKVGV